MIWVEYYDTPNRAARDESKVNVITLNRSDTYHSSYCFNRGIAESKGEVIVIPDADQIVPPDFLSRVWRLHAAYEKLVVYGYRYDEIKRGTLQSHAFDELEDKCIQKNPVNYGGCLTVRKKWLLDLNGYEQHPVFGTGFHANGTDMYTRFKNLGLAIQWEPSLRLYHPWHTLTLMPSNSYGPQWKVIEWRKKNLQYLAFEGIDPAKNSAVPDRLNSLLRIELDKLRGGPMTSIKTRLKKKIRTLLDIAVKFKRVMVTNRS